jgi:hypothetical protein
MRGARDGTIDTPLVDFCHGQNPTATRLEMARLSRVQAFRPSSAGHAGSVII